MNGLVDVRKFMCYYLSDIRVDIFGGLLYEIWGLDKIFMFEGGKKVIYLKFIGCYIFKYKVLIIWWLKFVIIVILLRIFFGVEIEL